MDIEVSLANLALKVQEAIQEKAVLIQKEQRVTEVLTARMVCKAHQALMACQEKRVC